ncbi:fumarylacetoacetate hydrolase family protein [Gallaecimonas sp. GXIMD1310]|uniref:fumarylacetoacetate hydrolase family protein n=1 Tax=Gallaecimonas sp. GXIMD1310 TaxID=3131926 RepID=UPI00324A2C74
MKWDNQTPLPWPCSKIVCVGRNYAEHARELGNAVPDKPLLFIKPPTTLRELEDGFSIPADRGAVHFECELAVLIGQQLTQASTEQAQQAVVGIGLALDLTLRDVQQQLKSAGQPWERAKSFDGSCPVTPLVPVARFTDLPLRFQLYQNGELRQDGDSRAMLMPIPALLAYISESFTLCPGDLVLTGTPAGVGPLHSGDQLRLILADQLTASCQVR